MTKYGDGVRSYAEHLPLCLRSVVFQLYHRCRRPCCTFATLANLRPTKKCSSPCWHTYIQRTQGKNGIHVPQFNLHKSWKRKTFEAIRRRKAHKDTQEMRPNNQQKKKKKTSKKRTSFDFVEVFCDCFQTEVNNFQHFFRLVCSHRWKSNERMVDVMVAMTPTKHEIWIFAEWPRRKRRTRRVAIVLNFLSCSFYFHLSFLVVVSFSKLLILSACLNKNSDVYKWNTLQWIEFHLSWKCCELFHNGRLVGHFKSTKHWKKHNHNGHHFVQTDWLNFPNFQAFDFILTLRLINT